MTIGKSHHLLRILRYCQNSHNIETLLITNPYLIIGNSIKYLPYESIPGQNLNPLGTICRTIYFHPHGTKSKLPFIVTLQRIVGFFRDPVACRRVPRKINIEQVFSEYSH